MNTTQQVRVFDSADLIRDAVTMLCRDRLPRLTLNPDLPEERERRSAIDQLCWDVFALQSRSFPIGVLIEKCSAIISRTPYQPIHRIRAEELANEISSPVGGW